MLAFLLYFGALYIFLMAVEQLVLVLRRRSSWTGPFFFTTLAYCLLQLGLYATDSYQRYPFLILTHVPAMILAAPLTLFFIQDLLQLNVPDQKRWLHFLPVLIGILLLLPYFILPSEIKLELLYNRQTTVSPGIIAMVRAGLVLSLVWNVLYGLLLLKDTFFLLRALPESDAVRIRFGVGIALGLVLCALLAVVGQLYWTVLKQWAALGVLLVFIIIQIVVRVDPGFVAALRDEVERTRYARSRLLGVDISDALARIKHQLEEVCIYRDESLSLSMLAAEVQLSPAQLSEIINSRFQKNFKSFINEYRVGEARQLLVQDLERPVLEIAYAVGFNSKSTFYAAFALELGQTPQEYRKLQSRPAIEVSHGNHG